MQLPSYLLTKFVKLAHYFFVGNLEMKNFIQKFFSDKSEKTYAKMAEMNGSISEELKSRVRSSTAKTKGYEKFDNTSFNFIDLEMNEENSESIQQDSDYQLDAKNYSKLEKVKSKRSFLKIKNKSRWIVPPNSEYLSNVDSSISNSVPSISAMATVAN